MARVPMTLNDLKAAMRDDRYWQGGHPEHDAYRHWVAQGWQEFGAVGALDDEGGTVVVQVSGYQRTRNGRREQVQPYEQRRRAAEDEANDNAAQVAPAPAASPEVPAGPTQDVVVIFVGGGGDRWFTGQVARYSEEVLRRDQTFSGLRTRHFDWDQQHAIERFIRDQASTTSVRLVGHSWGADTAANVAAALGRDGHVLDMLVTVDPVGNSDERRPAAIAAARAGTRRWVNVLAVGGPSRDFSDTVAAVGGRWAGDARGVADEFIEASVSHAGFRRMMLEPTADGRTLLEAVTGRSFSGSRQ